MTLSDVVDGLEEADKPREVTKPFLLSPRTNSWKERSPGKSAVQERAQSRKERSPGKSAVQERAQSRKERSPGKSAVQEGAVQEGAVQEGADQTVDRAISK